MKQIFKYVPLCALLLLSNNMQAVEAVNGCTVDMIIVGDGTAGCLLANRLSQPDSSGKSLNSVLVLETGQNRTTDPNVLAVPFISANALSTSPKYGTYNASGTTMAGSAGTFGTALQYSQGKMWGGSSAHNFLGAVRGSPGFWNRMATASGNPLFNYIQPNGILGFAKALETYTPFPPGVLNPVQRGTSGPVFITQIPGANPTDPLVLQINAVTGSPIIDDYNAGSTLAISIGQVWATPTNPPLRSFSATAFEDASVVTVDGVGVNGRALRILSGAHATKILFSGTKAIGVQYYQNGQYVNVFARKRVILCAGCPFSAQLLQLSGIGSKADFSFAGVDYPGLDTLGIPVVVNNPAVGAGLKTHYGPFAISNNVLGTVQGYNVWIDGTVTPGNTPVPPYNDPTTVGTRKFQMSPFPFFALANSETLLALGLPSPEGLVTSFLFWNTEPKSTGSAFIVDNNPFSVPLINFNFYSDGDLTDSTSDLSAAVAALKIAAQISGGAANMLFPSTAAYGSDTILADIAVSQLVDSFITVTNHYSGTCNFGTVVDSNFKVIGTDNVYVVDNSVYPFPEDGNTASSAYYAAEVYLATHGIPF